MTTTIDRTWYDTLVDDSGSGLDGSVWDKADVDALLDAIDALLAGSLTIGAPLTLDQGAADTAILNFVSSDVAHGMTAIAPTDVYGKVQKVIGASGGLRIDGFRAGAGAYATQILGHAGAAADTAKSTVATGVIDFTANVKSGTSLTAVGANGNLLVVTNDGTTRFILDGEGDSHQDVGTAWTNFDFANDVELLTALSVGVSMADDPFRAAFGHLLERHRPMLEHFRIVTFNDDGHHFINWSRAHMLVIGAVRQQAEKLAALEGQIARLTRLVEGSG